MTRGAARCTPIAAAATAASSATCTRVATRWKDDVALMFQRTPRAPARKCSLTSLLLLFLSARRSVHGEHSSISSRREGLCTHLWRRYFNRWSNIKAFNACNALHEEALSYPCVPQDSLSLSFLFTLISQRQKIVCRSFYCYGELRVCYVKRPINGVYAITAGGETVAGRASEAKVAR